MTEGRAIGAFVILCADDEPAVLESLERDLRGAFDDKLAVEGCRSGAELLERAQQLAARNLRVPVVIADQVMPGMSGVDALIRLHETGPFQASRKVLLSARATLDDVARALNRGALNATLPKPWEPEVLAQAVRHLLTEYLIENAPETLDQFSTLADVSQVSQAYLRAERRRRSMDEQLKTLQRSFIEDQDLSDAEVEASMINEIDRVLNHPERQQLPEGTVLLQEGQPVSGIWIILSGRVSLYRVIGDRELVFHSQTVGPIVGLMSLAYRRNSFFTCRALTDITVIKVSLPELEVALQKSATLSVHFVTVLIRSLARRNRRAVELQIEVNALNRDLARERDQLADTLKKLEQAHMRLVESEKLATLGQLAAGIAHELNNPVAAITRAADFVYQDLAALASSHPDGRTAEALVQAAMTRPPVSTREQREQRAALTAEIGDEDLARRLVAMGITNRAEYQRLLAQAGRADEARRLEELEHYFQLGTSLRNIKTCAERITALVGSLRSYARPDRDVTFDVDIHKGLEETLLLFGHELRNLTVERQYGQVPRIACRVGELNQVWTNLISNALQVMGRDGVLRVATDVPAPGKIRVRIIDNGPGIAPEHMERIFDLNFTTRQGSADFGLGLGLPICRDIVTRHGGAIEVESRPGNTCFSVVLPVRPPEPATEAPTRNRQK